LTAIVPPQQQSISFHVFILWPQTTTMPPFADLGKHMNDTIQINAWWALQPKSLRYEGNHE